MRVPFVGRLPGEAVIVMVIIVAILVPSMLLSIFSIKAISAQRATTEQRIRESYESLVHRLARESADSVSEMRRKLKVQTEDVKETATVGAILNSLRSAYPCLRYEFLISREGEIAIPAMYETRKEADAALVPTLIDALGDAYRSEFEASELEVAAARYRAIRDSKMDKVFRAAAAMGYARSLVKLGRIDSAREAFRYAAAQFPLVRGEASMLTGLSSHLGLLELDIAKPPTSEELTGDITDFYSFVHSNREKLREGELALIKKQDTELTAVIKQLATSHQGGETVARSRFARILKLREIFAEANLRDEAYARLAKRLLPRMEEIFESGREFSYLLQASGGIQAIFTPLKLDSGWWYTGFLIDTLLLEKYIIAPLCEKLNPKDEKTVLVAFGADNRQIGEQEESVDEFYLLTEANFGVPLQHYRCAIYLKDAGMLHQLSSIRTKFYVWAVVISIAGIIAGIVVTYLVVRRKMHEAQRKSDFLSSITHELKTPLTSICMLAETLADRRVKDELERRKCVDIILVESERLGSLIDRVLEMARMERKMRQYVFVESDIRAVIQQTVATFKSHLQEQDCNITLDLPDVLTNIWIDSEAIGDLLNNLLSNAYKYSPDGEKDIWLNAFEESRYIIVEVIDRGIGIPAGQQKAIFKQFHRVDDRLTRAVGGFGLGLTIAKNIAEAHGGRITVESRPGKGSKFSLILNKR